MIRRRRFTFLVRTTLALGASVVFAGCATYTDKMLLASQAAAGGDYVGAVASLNQFLGVDSSSELPEKWGADRALAVLERGTLLQSIGRYEDAARDLSAAEQEIEMIDLTKDPIGTLGGYIYSDSAQPYVALPSERLTLSAVNLLNYLAQDDLDGAAVEARRFQVTRNYFETAGLDDQGIFPMGSYLAGFVFEAIGEGDRSLRYYEEALEAGQLASLRAPAARLAAVHPYRGPRLAQMLATAKASAKDPNSGELLVVLNLGRVSHKVPERLPIGLAIGIVGAEITEDLEWLSRGAAKVVVYPALVSTPSRLGSPSLSLDGQPLTVDPIVDLDAAVRREYEALKPKIIAAAVTRLAARAAVAEGVRQAGKQEDQLLGEILGLVVETAMVAMDKPDTRSWTMMPAQVLATRIRLPAGAHQLDLQFSGLPSAGRQINVDIPAGGVRTVVITEPR